MVAVTYLDTVLESRFTGGLAERPRPEHRRLAAVAIARGADASRRVSAADHGFGEDDYDYIPLDPFEALALLTDEAADRVRSAWVEACLAELSVALRAIRSKSRTPEATLALMRRLLRILLRTTMPLHDPANIGSCQVEPPRSGDPAVSVITLTAPTVRTCAATRIQFIWSAVALAA